MKIIDLSHTISTHMPVFPGAETPLIDPVSTIKEKGYAERKVTLLTHIGTHIDAPAHILPNSLTLDRIPLDCFFGNASVIDLSTVPNPEITVDDLEKKENLFKTGEFILLHFGWSRFWGQDRYFGNFPTLTMEAALWICSFNLKGIGIDAISFDKIDSTTIPIHKVLLERMLLIENLTNLHLLPETGFFFSGFPLKIENADGFPVRAAAIIQMPG